MTLYWTLTSLITSENSVVKKKKKKLNVNKPQQKHVKMKANIYLIKYTPIIVSNIAINR